MKRILAMTLVLAMILALGACGKKAPEAPAAEPTPEPTAAPTPTPIPAPTPSPEPAWEPGYSRLGNWGLLWTTYQRGDEVTVLGKWNDYFIIEGEEADLLVEQRFLRPEGEQGPEEWPGWAQANTPVYPSGYLLGDPIETLALNTEVRVVDSKANWAYIEWEGGSGYVDPSKISDHYIVPYTGGGNGGGYVPPLPSGPMDGTDVNMGDLAFLPEKSPVVSLLGSYCGPEYEKFEPCPGVILSDETEAYLCFLVRPDELKVTEVGETECTILINDLLVTVPRWIVRLATDEEYAPWEAYAKSGAVAYKEYQQINELKTFSFNERVWVVDHLEELDLYVVEIDGEFGYVKLGDLSETPFTAYAGGNGGTGGGGPVGPAPGPGGSTGVTPEWTPPIL